MPLLNTLINKQDNSELIGLKIVEILLQERDNQKTLAADALLDPTPWHFRVFHETSSCVEEFETESDDKSPIVNVWFDSNTTDRKASNVVDRQAVDGIYNIDCYGYGISAETTEGHLPSDTASALEAQRIARIVRNILMSNAHVWLEMKGVIAERMMSGLQMFKPQQDNGEPVTRVVGARLRLEVRHEERSVQMSMETIEQISINVRRKSTGEMYINTMYDYSD